MRSKALVALVAAQLTIVSIAAARTPATLAPPTTAPTTAPARPPTRAMTTLPSTAPAPVARPFVRFADFHRVAHYDEHHLGADAPLPDWRARYAGHVRTDFRAYVADGTPDEVFKALTTAPPSKTWHGPHMTFRAAYEPGQQTAMKPGTWQGLQEGQRLFLDLRGAPHTDLVDMAIGVKVTRVDPAAHEIRFQYTSVTPSVGEQRIRLFPVRGADGQLHTRIEHTTEFAGKSTSVAALYPHFHGKILGEFYRAALGKIVKQ